MKDLLALAAAATALMAPGTGAANDANEDDEPVTRVSTRVSCVGGTAQLRLEAEHDDGEVDAIQVELRVAVRRPVYSWRLVLVHERRLVYQGRRRSHNSGHSLLYARTVPEWEGRQTIVARLATPSGRTCRLQATI
jgi:hypothetical protein